MKSGPARLSVFVSPDGGYGVQVALDGKTVFTQAAPVAVGVVGEDGAEQWRSAGYRTVAARGGDWVCEGEVRTPAGTEFRVFDVYHALEKLSAFTMTRRVEIVTPSGDDKGFNSRFSLSPSGPAALADEDVFAPGIWYKDNAHVPPGALAGSRDDREYWFREDRLPLPLVMTRDRRSGATLAIAHLDGVPTTFAGEDGLSRIIDARMQFGALGVRNEARPEPAFVFPGTEGERSYIAGPAVDGKRWAYRSHPVAAGVAHRYRLLIQVGRTPDFPAAVRRTWRTVYDLYRPPVIRVDLNKCYKDGMEALSAYIRPSEGVPDVPFAVTMPGGQVKDTSSQMGFVGQALPSAALLLRYGFETQDADAVARASQVVDFWAKNSPSPAGIPRTWYDIHPSGVVTWRDYHTFLRVASDGLDGALRAWDAARAHGQDHPEWLAFCRAYGDWLTRAQNPDGSWAREYDFTGHVVNTATDTTDQPIPFLIHLFRATGDARYRQAALKAGEFSWATVHLAYAYVGGTPDNPNVMDKEGGMMALGAFLALYDATHDRKWLTAASQAAWYSETWTYCWNIPIPTDDPKVIYPHNRTTYGLSLIAAGHSGADNYMAAAPYDLYRLSLLTHEPHFRVAARMLLHDTKQMTDWDSSLGYAHPGLLTEALTLPPPRGHGVSVWLPWLTVALLEPMTQLQDTYGSMDIDQIEKLPERERVRRDGEYEAAEGF
ncbi:hypothetical protein CCAX7_63630 [Capsulimonas corticalis]|uniref:Uncharacterized protein n=1 Tax=Capsulimonas corticalis TaxID=2219043 RepID=A0A402CX24_9BACT|nr:hypothetical protein [Capsulimonas corticalis]BDI34312.1 hypothetical protein CCAX7_63630 [Capsulimonas corticalis]